jgi:putative DNA primase/helicase
MTTPFKKQAIQRSRERPVPVVPLPDHLPVELRRLATWIGWRYEWDDQRRSWSKIPINPRTGYRAKTNDPATWGALHDALTAVERFKLDGPAIVLTRNREKQPFDLVGVDFDNVRDIDSGILTPAAKELVERFATYTEVSPSGTGCKLICMAAWPDDQQACGRNFSERGIEIYREKFWCLTGHRLPGLPITIEERTEQVALLWQECVTHLQSRDREGARTHRSHRSLSVAALTERVRAYLQRCPPAIEGQNGSRRLMKTLRLVIDGFDLDDALARQIAEEYSAKCEPPWSPKEIDHAVTNIKAKPSKQPRGWLLNKDAVGSPRAQTADTGADAEEPIHFTDLGNGKRFARAYGTQARFCHTWGKWLFWDGARWRIDDRGRAHALAKQTVLELYRRARAQIDALAQNPGDAEGRSQLKKIQATLAWALKSQSAPRINALLDLARSEPGIPVLPDDLDRGPWLLNCSNGTLDLRTQTLRPHDPADYLTKLCPVEYNPGAKCPDWERFLSEIFDCSDSLMAYLQRLAGYWLTGLTTEHALAVLWGSGANGKSTLINALFHVLGPDYSGKASRDLLLVSHGEKHPTALASLHGKRFVAAIESVEGARLDETLIKELTGGDQITARRMREDFWTFEPTHKIALATNHKPQVRGQDYAIWRRLRLIPFTVCFLEDKQDKKLGEKLRAEAPGILTWLVKGCKLWQQHGLQDPPEVLEATGQYRSEQDTLGAFLSDRCLQGPTYQAKASVLYAAYKDWCEQSGERTLSKRKFCAALREKGFEGYTNNGPWFRGIALAEPTDRNTD